jgi:glycerol-3-phosphate dehydrogenase (NAD(P)+)
MDVSVIGSGGWGTTLGNLIAKKGQLVKIWSYEAATVELINSKHENPQFLQGISLSSNLVASSDFNEVIPDADIIIFAVPSNFVRHLAN